MYIHCVAENKKFVAVVGSLSMTETVIFLQWEDIFFKRLLK
jgi:hypothetical protein